MARRWQFTNDLTAGEIAPQFLARSDADLRNRAAKQARNVLLLPGGGYRRRWGTRDLAGLDGDARLETIGVGADDAQIIVFLHEAFQVYDLEGVMVDEVTGCPWTTAELRTMQIAAENDRIFVCSQEFWPQQLTFSGGSWAVGDMEFATGVNNTLRQPYYRFAARGVAIQPNGYTGSVQVNANANIFSAAYVGTRIRYSGIEILITSYTDPDTVVGTVIGSLFPTVDVTVGSTSGFLAGHTVQGIDTNIAGVVSQVVSGTVLRVQLIDSYTYFDSTEKLVGPNAQSTISAVSLHGTPAATTDWDEQVISPARGYPGACAFHRNRLLLGRFESVENLFCASAVNDPTDFDVGTGADNDAIVDTLGRDKTVKVRHFASTEQLLVFTEVGPFYVPEQVTAALSPTNLELLQIGPESAGSAAPVLMSEGFLFSEQGSGRLLGAIPTGNVRRSWDISDMAELAPHLMGTPVELEIVPAGAQTDRLVCQLRSDGTIAVMYYRRAAENTSWVLWTTDGEWRSIVAANGSLYAAAKRTIGGVDAYRLERFDADTLGDGVAVFATTAAAYADYADTDSLSLWSGDNWVAEVDLDADGEIVSPPGVDGEVEIGFDFTDTVELVPPIDGEFGLKPKTRICRAWLDVIESGQVSCNGYTPSGYLASEGVGGAVPMFSGQLVAHMLGHQRMGTLTITQARGEPLEVRSITMEVTS